MTLMFRRALTALTATATVATTTMAVATPAVAGTEDRPSATAAGCPDRPADAIGNWTCFFLTVLEGTVRFKNLTIVIDQPIRMTIAQGFLITGKIGASASPLSGGPLSISTPLPGGGGLPDLSGIKVELHGAGPITPGLPIPTAIGVKARLVHPLVGENCWLGSDDAPIVIKPVTGSLSVGLVDSTPALKVQSSDGRFTVPAASGCGAGPEPADSTINSVFGLPSAAGQGQADWLYGVWSAQF